MSSLEVGEDFPQVCETCLGGNPYVRMAKQPFGTKVCKISARPFQSFRWRAGPAGREKETVVCIAVAKEKNICQACLNDMVFGLPVGARDAMLRVGPATAAPSSDVGKLYHYNQLEDGAQQSGMQLAGGMKALAAVQQLDKFSKRLYGKQTSSSAAKGAAAGIWDEFVPAESSSSAPLPRGPVPFRNLPKLCSFWVAGTCSRVTRGACPFRPCCGPAAYAFPELAASNKQLCAQLLAELAERGPAAAMAGMDEQAREGIRAALRGNNRDKSIAQRVAGEDALSAKYVRAMRGSAEEAPAAGGSTLWLGGLGEEVAEADVSGALYGYGNIVGVRMARQSGCAFVEFSQRAEAQSALQASRRTHPCCRMLMLLRQAGPLLLGGSSVRVGWARAPGDATGGEGAEGAAARKRRADEGGSQGGSQGVRPSASRARLGSAIP